MHYRHAGLTGDGQQLGRLVHGRPAFQTGAAWPGLHRFKDRFALEADHAVIHVDQHQRRLAAEARKLLLAPLQVMQLVALAEEVFPTIHCQSPCQRQFAFFLGEISR